MIKRLLVLHGGALGDCVLALRLIEGLRRTWGESLVTLAARSSIAGWASKHRFVDEACSLDGMLPQLSLHAGAHPAHETASRPARFDAIVSFLGGAIGESLAEWSKSTGGRFLRIDPAPIEALSMQGRHITSQWRHQLVEQGVEFAEHDVSDSALDEADRRGFRRALASRARSMDAPILLCHPGSGGLSKCCPLELLRRFVRFKRDRGWAVHWMIGPDEMERCGEAYTRRLSAAAPVLYEESVEKAADWVAGADVYVGNDAGMTHVAALAGVPTVALFGPTDPRVWRPLGKHVEVVRFTWGDRQ